MDSFSPTNFSRLIDNNRSLRRNRSNDEMDPEESLNSEEEEIAFEKWNPDVETVNINWKGWKRSEHPKLRRGSRPPHSKGGGVLKLSELAAKCVAVHIPFEMVEKFQPPVPEELQQRITFWSFPEWDDDICLYTCLANSNDDEFLRGEILFENNNVYDVIQIGFHLNATVGVSNGDKFSVSISFDRRRITSCICTCKAVPLWCCHIVAVCLLRIYNPAKVQLRPPISESLTRLNRDQLQKFSQYLVSSLPEQYLQTAQRLLDDLNSGQPLPINLVSGAPDTTAGASVHECAMWCLDDHQLHLNVKKQMNRFGNIPPMVFSDVNMLTNNIPAIINEYNSMLRPLKIGEPDSLWNLLSIVRDMYRKNDRNALPLLEIITDEMTNCVQIILWWFANKSGLNGDCGYQIKYYYNGNSNSYIYQASASRLCDEIVSLWRLAALNPAITPKERVSLKWKFKDWHFKIIDLIWNNWKHTPTAFDLYNFSGFKSCVEACKLTWSNFPLPGITYAGIDMKKDNSWMYDCHPFTLGIDVKKLNCIRNPSESLQTALNTCYFHVERVRSTVCRVLSETVISSELPDYRTIKYLKEHFSSPRDEVFRFVAHLITMVDTWVNDECDDGEITLAYMDMGGSDKHRSHSRTIDNDYYHAVIQGSKEDLREKKIALERTVNSELRKKITSSSICSNARQVQNVSIANVELDDTVEMYHLQWEVYDMIMDEYDDDNPSSGSQGAVCSSSPSFFDTRHLPTNSNYLQNAIFEIFADMDDIWQSLVIRAEGLWAFGHTREACYIVRKVAENIINRPPDLKVMCSGAFVKPKRRKGQAVINPTAHRLTFMAVEKMELYKFLLNILASSSEHYDVAFKIGLLSLELPRAPASIKPLEVKLFHLENDIADILRKIPLTDEQYKILRTRLEKLRTGNYKARGPKLLPNALTSYILDVTMINSLDGKSRSVSKEISETLCFEAALASLSLKPDVCEFEHSLLVEGLRRQRCDLALRMLDLYKDEPKKVFKIMDVIIDQEIDVNMKRPLHLWYYQDKAKQEERLKTIIERHKKKKKKKSSSSGPNMQLPPYSNPPQHLVGQPPQVPPQSQIPPPPPPQLQLKKPMSFPPAPPMNSSQTCLMNRRHMGGAPPPHAMPTVPMQPRMPPNMPNASPMNMMPFMCNNSFLPPNHPRAARPVLPNPPPHHFPSTNPDMNAAPNARANAGQMRFPHLLPPQYQLPMQPPPPPSNMLPPFHRPPNGFACGIPQGAMPRPSAMPPAALVMKSNVRGMSQNVMIKHGAQRNGMMSQKTTKNNKCGKTGCKRPVSMVYRNRSTEALAHSMTELAKSVLFRSGGHLASSFYIRDSETGNVKTPNHVLHMCALQLAMYGLGIANNASTSWESRSYSPHVAMLTSLAIDIGAPALMFIIENWPGHLTPGEANSLADRGSRSENPDVQNLAARLALSCLSYADKLTSHEIIQAINQCRNLGLNMQEKACCEIEKVAKTHSLQSDVLFHVSKLWYNIYSKDELDDLEEAKSMKASSSTAPSRCLPVPSHFCVYRPVSTISGQSKSSSVLLNEVSVLKKRTYYLLASYRLSMMAFQNLNGDINEEKAHYRFHCLPNYTNDVYRTMQIAKLLGDKWVHHFGMVVENTLVNPFLLYEVACSASLHFARCNPSALHYIMSTVVKNLINKCEAMFFLYLHNKLYNMAQYEEEEFINMALLAHKAFSVSTDGPYRYQEWLQSLRSHEGSMRDMYMKITKAIEQEERSNKCGNEITCKETSLPFYHDVVKIFPENKLKTDEKCDDDDEDDDDEEEEEEEDNDDDEEEDADNGSVQTVMDDQQPGPSNENRNK